jgi:hypothetical protein
LPFSILVSPGTVVDRMVAGNGNHHKQTLPFSQPTFAGLLLLAAPEHLGGAGGGALRRGIRTVRNLPEELAGGKRDEC